MCEEKYKSYTKKIRELGFQMDNFPTPDVDTFLAIKLKIQKELIPIFENIVIDLLGLKKLPQLNLNNVVQGITYALNNSNKKINDKNFYTQNALSFIYTVKNVLSVTDHKCDLPAYKDKNPNEFGFGNKLLLDEKNAKQQPSRYSKGSFPATDEY